MRAGNDADVVAEPPVIQAVARFAAGLGIGRDFAVAVVSGREFGFDHVLHISSEVVVAERRRKAIKQRIIWGSR